MKRIIDKRYPDRQCDLPGCGKLITNRTNKNQRYCCRQHREKSRVGAKR